MPMHPELELVQIHTGKNKGVFLVPRYDSPEFVAKIGIDSAKSLHAMAEKGPKKTGSFLKEQANKILTLINNPRLSETTRKTIYEMKKQ